MKKKCPPPQYDKIGGNAYRTEGQFHCLEESLPLTFALLLQILLEALRYFNCIAILWGFFPKINKVLEIKSFT